MSDGKWMDIGEEQPPLNHPVLVSDGIYVGLAELHLFRGFTEPCWIVPGVSGYEWELDEPTHWQAVELPKLPVEKRPNEKA